MKRKNSLIILVAVLSLCCFNKVRAEILFQSDFENSATVSTTVWPDDPNDHDPNIPTVGSWSIDEDWDEGVQVSSYTGGGQPASAHSGSNYLISGWHGQDYPSWDHKGLATAEFTPVSQAVVDFWVYSFEGQYGRVHGRDLHGINDKAFELVFWTDSSPTTEVKYDGIVLTAQMTKDAWNHIVVELDLINDTAGVTVNDQATEYFTTLATTDLLDTLLFRDEYTGYYDDIQVDSAVFEPETTLARDDFESNTTASTAAWPDSSGDYDPDNPAAGTWSIDEDWDEGVQVSSYTGGGQPASAHSGSNYLISGWHGQTYPSWDHKGLATIEFTPVSQAVVDFWVYSFEGQYGTVHGRDLQGVNDKAFELVFWTDSSTAEVEYDGTVLTAQLTKDAWNHVVVDLDLINDTAGVTINSQATEYFTTLATTDLLDTLLFRDEYTGYYDDISVSEPNAADPALMSYYPFNGTLEDTIGPYDGTVMPGGEPNYIAGPYSLGQALLLDGSKYVDIGYGQPKGEVMRNGSVSLWFNMSADPVQYKMFLGTFNDGVSEGIWSGVTTSNLIDFEIRNGAGQNVTWDNNRENISSDTWYFYTATWGINSQTGNLDVNEYLDGALIRSGTQTDLGAVSWQYPMALGAGNSRGSVEDYFVGALDEIKFYNYPLNAAEVQQEYINATGIPICLDPPVADFTGDCKVDLNDLARLAAEWLLDGNLYP